MKRFKQQHEELEAKVLLKYKQKTEGVNITFPANEAPMINIRDKRNVFMVQVLSIENGIMLCKKDLGNIEKYSLFDIESLCDKIYILEEIDDLLFSAKTISNIKTP